MRWSAALAAAALLASLASPARAFFTAGDRVTSGNFDYFGEYAYLYFGGKLNFRTSFSSYHDDFSSGTFRTYSGRLAYDETGWGVGLTGGGTPSVNNYGNWFFGLDGRVTFLFGESPEPEMVALKSPSEDLFILEAPSAAAAKPGWGFTRLDLRPSVLRILHGERAQLFPSADSGDVGETDFKGTVGFLVLKDYFTVDLTKAHYDHSLTGSVLRAQTQNIAGLYSMIQGFPNTSFNVRADLTMVPYVVPFLGYGHTTFELGQPSLRVDTIGAYLRVIPHFELAATYQRLRESGEQDLDLKSLEASLKF